MHNVALNKRETDSVSQSIHRGTACRSKANTNNLERDSAYDIREYLL